MAIVPETCPQGHDLRVLASATDGSKVVVCDLPSGSEHQAWVVPADDTPVAPDEPLQAASPLLDALAHEYQRMLREAGQLRQQLHILTDRLSTARSLLPNSAMASIAAPTLDQGRAPASATAAKDDDRPPEPMVRQ